MIKNRILYNEYLRNIKIYGNYGCLIIGDQYIHENKQLKDHFESIDFNRNYITEFSILDINNDKINSFLEIINYFDNNLNQKLYSIFLISKKEGWYFNNRSEPHHFHIPYLKGKLDDIRMFFDPASIILDKIRGNNVL